MPKVSLEKLLETGAHFGHQTRRWNPKMQEYIYGEDGGVHIFDLTKTAPLIEEALEVLKNASSEGKTIVFLGTKKQVKTKVEEIARATGSLFVSSRWLGGTFTNFEAIKRSIVKLADMKDKRANGEYGKFTKKERVLLDREIDRLERLFGGIAGLTKLPDILVVVDVKREGSAIREAKSVGVTTIGIVDSNSEPDVTHIIPMNDDAVKALEYILDLMGEAINEGKGKKKVAESTPEKKVTKKVVARKTSAKAKKE